MKKTQGRQLIALLKERPMTTMELLSTGISTCPWKRIREQMPDGWKIQASKNDRGLNVYRVVWTA
jgi:hypothetical protein